MVGEHEDRRVVRRVSAPPARPGLVPWSPAAAEHLTTHDGGADILDDPSMTSESTVRAPPSRPCCSRPLSVANAHSCRRIPPLPIGFSRLWSVPATKPSSDIEIWHVTEFMTV